MADQRWYDQGLRPRVLINWDSFVAQGINAAWQGAFTSAVLNAYTRWMNVAGVDLRFQFWNYTNQTQANNGELLIQMDPIFGGGGGRIASTLGNYNRLTIIFHRRNAPTATPFAFVPFNADPGEIDMQAVLMHEMGHCLGLDHGTNANETMIPWYDYHSGRFGPFEGDVVRLKAVYNDYAQNRLRQLRSGDGGSTWSVVANELTSFNHYNTRTNASPAAAGLTATGLYIVGWTHANRVPSWLRNDGDKFLMRRWFYFGGERDVHGGAYCSDENGQLLWARVGNDDNASIGIRRSVNRGQDWFWAGTPAGAQACGTPGLAFTRVGAQRAWILVWSHFDRNDHLGTGRIRASVSLDDGWTWSAPTVLNAGLKALSGVAAAADDANNVLVAFASAPHAVVGLNEIRVMRCAVAGSQLTQTGVIATTDATRVQPALTFDRARGRFIMAWRGQNFLTTLSTMTTTPGGSSFSNRVDLAQASHTAPALASVAEYGESVLWYAYEGAP
jgi:hypothetical protein